MLNGEGKFEEKEMKFRILEKSSKIKKIKKIDQNKKEEKSQKVLRSPKKNANITIQVFDPRGEDEIATLFLL